MTISAVRFLPLCFHVPRVTFSLLQLGRTKSFREAAENLSPWFRAPSCDESKQTATTALELPSTEEVRFLRSYKPVWLSVPVSIDQSSQLAKSSGCTTEHGICKTVDLQPSVSRSPLRKKKIMLKQSWLE